MNRRSFLRSSVLTVGAQIKQGKTKADILKATEIPGSPEWKGDGIERPLGAAYEEMTGI
jgi:cyclase